MAIVPFSDLLERNEKYSQTHKAILKFDETPADKRPTTCIVTCADPRVHPETFLNLTYGEAVVFRTIAGHPQLILKDIVALDAFLNGAFKEIILIHHTNCGSTIFTDEGIRTSLSKSVPEQSSEIANLTFGAVSTSIEENIREDVDWLKSQPLVRPDLKGGIKGFLYNITDGKVREVV